MGKLRPLPAARVIKILETYGFRRGRQSGSHIEMTWRYDDQTSTVVIVPAHKEIAVGTLTSIIRQSTLPREFFEVD